MKTLTVGIDTFTVFGNILYYELVDCYYFIGHQRYSDFCTNFRSLISAMDWYEDMEPQLLALYQDNVREFPNEITEYPDVDIEEYTTLIAHCTQNPQVIREIINGQNACAKYTLIRRPDLSLSDDELFDLYNSDYSEMTGKQINKTILRRTHISESLLERIIDIPNPKYLTKDIAAQWIVDRHKISDRICEKISDTTNNYVIDNLLSRVRLTPKTLENLVKNTDSTATIARALRFDNRRFTINDTYQLAYQDLIDIDNVDELEALYEQNMAESPDEDNGIIDDSNNSEFLCILAALENKNPKTLDFLIDHCFYMETVRHLLAMRNDLTPDMLVRLLNKEYKNKKSNAVAGLIDIIMCDNHYSSETLTYIIRNSSAQILSILAEYKLDENLIREIYSIANNNNIFVKLINNAHTPLDIIEDMIANHDDTILYILNNLTLPQYLYEYLLSKEELSIEMSILNGNKFGYRLPEPLFYRTSSIFKESKTVRRAIVMSNTSEDV